MSLGGLGARDSRGGFPFLLAFSVLLLLGGVLLFGRELVYYSGQAGALQSDVRIAGVQVGGLSESQAQARWEDVYLDQPVKLVYRGSPIMVDPRSVGFSLNNEAMLADARAQSAGDENFWTGFMAYLMGREEKAVEVPLDASVQENQLRAALEDLSARYDALPSTSTFDITSLVFRGGAGGSRLDVDSSTQMIMEALYNPDPAARVLELPTVAVEGEAVQMDDLRQAILDFMQVRGFLHDGATTIGSVYVMDLKTGQEMAIMGDVAHSAVSTIKVGVLINYFRHQTTTPDDDSAFLLSAAVICSANSAANLLMQLTGNPNQGAGQALIEGLRNTTQTMIDVGATNSAILSPLYVGPEGSYPTIARPESPTTPNATYNAQADTLNLTTAEDMGTMMAMIYDCANNGGGLRAVYPNEVTQTECQQILEIMSGVRFSRFAELGVPADVPVAHKVGYGAETVGDVAVVYSPATDYVFVMYIWEDDSDNDGITELDKWELIDETARIVYNYFNPDAPLLEARPPDNPLGGAACVLPTPGNPIDLNDIDVNRFDAMGNPLESACYDWPQCRPFDNWGRGG